MKYDKIQSRATASGSLPGDAQDLARVQAEGFLPSAPGDTEGTSDVNAENLSTGYVALYRSLLEHPLFRQHPCEYLKIWIYFLLKAARKPRQWWDGRTEHTIPVGGFIGSINTISENCKVSRGQAERAISVFAKCEMVDVKPGRHNSMYVVSNFESYQVQQKTSGHKQDTNETLTGRERDASETIAGRERDQTIGNRVIGDRKEGKKNICAAKPRGRERLFEQFWEIVWAKIGRGKAKAVWVRKVNSPELGNQIIEAAKVMGPLLQQRADIEGRQVVHPATWLNGERWTDDIDTLRGMSTSAPPRRETLGDKLLRESREPE